MIPFSLSENELFTALMVIPEVGASAHRAAIRAGHRDIIEKIAASVLQRHIVANEPDASKTMGDF